MKSGAAKSPNLLAYNPISYQSGLPSLKLFREHLEQDSGEKDLAVEYFESVINQALIIHPAERGYFTLQDFKVAMESASMLGPWGYFWLSWDLMEVCGLWMRWNE